MICYQKVYAWTASTHRLYWLEVSRWIKPKKHQPGYRRQWRKLHIGVDAETLQIRAVQLTTNNVSDSQVLSNLLN